MVDRHYLETDLGNLVYEQGFLTRLAGQAAGECRGLAGMSSRNLRDDLATFINRENLSRGVEVRMQGDNVVLEVDIVVYREANIREVARRVMQKLKSSIEENTGLTVERVNVNVTGIKL